MSPRSTGRLAWALAAASTCLALAYVVLLRVDVLSGRNVNFDQHWLPGVFWAIAWPTLGAVVLSNHPRNRLAWVFLLVGLGAGVGLFTEQYVVHASLVEPGSLPAAPLVGWVGVVAGNLSWQSIVLVPQLFPNGRPLSARWRWLLRLSVILMVAGAAWLAGIPGRLFDGVPVDNPFGLDLPEEMHRLSPFAQALLAPVVAVVILGSLTSLVLRYRRAQGPERQQMKLFVAAVVFSAVGLFVYPHLPYAFIVNAVLSLVPPVTFGLAIMRYRLYEIDRVISRTFSYAVLTGLLVGSYALLVTGVTRLVPVGSSLRVALATLVVAALFQPLRRRLQGIVDRRFNRARYDAERTVEAFSRRLRNEVDLEAVRRDLLAVVGQTVQPEHAGLWLSPEQRQR